MGFASPDVSRCAWWIGGARSGTGESEMDWGIRNRAEESEDWGNQKWLACNWYPPYRLLARLE